MRVSHLTVGAVLCAGSLVFGTPAWAATSSTGQASSTQAGGSQSTPATQDGGNAQAQASPAVVQLYQQVSNLEQEVRDLRGRNQELAHEIQTLRNRQRQLYMSTDQRLQALEAAVSGGHAGSTASNASGSAPASVTVPGAAGTSASAQAVTPAPNISGGGGGQQASQASGGTGTFTNGKDLAAYEKAFNLLKNSHYQEAIDAFRSFEKAYPKSPYVANAEYWTGEALYVERHFSQALAQFQKVVNNYPQSNKVSASMLKIGYSQYELKRWSAARTTLQNVVSQYPGTTAARLAADRLSRMKREGH